MNTHKNAVNNTIPKNLAAKERGGQLLLIGGGILLGTVGIFIEEAAQQPLLTVWFRCTFGALALLIWGFASRRTKELRLKNKVLWVAIISGILMIANWTLFFAAIPRTSIAVATVVFHIQPFWIIIFGCCFLREKVSLFQWMATLIALIGLVFATGLSFEDLSSGVVDDAYINGLVMCLIGSLCYAAVTVIAQTRREITSFALAWYQCAVGTVILVWVPLIYGWPSEASAWPWLIGLGIFHTGLAYALLFAGMIKLTLGKVAILQFVYPLTAIVVDWAIYDRVLDFGQNVGVILMALALWAVKKN